MGFKLGQNLWKKIKKRAFWHFNIFITFILGKEILGEGGGGLAFKGKNFLAKKGTIHKFIIKTIYSNKLRSTIYSPAMNGRGPQPGTKEISKLEGITFCCKFFLFHPRGGSPLKAELNIFLKFLFLRIFWDTGIVKRPNQEAEDPQKGKRSF